MAGRDGATAECTCSARALADADRVSQTRRDSGGGASEIVLRIYVFKHS